MTGAKMRMQGAGRPDRARRGEGSRLACLSAVTLMALLLLAGCSSGKITGAEGPAGNARFTAMEIYRGQDAMAVSAGISKTFEARLRRQLTRSNGFVQGEGLRLLYRFISFDPGDRMTRYMTLGLSGEAVARVEVRMFDAQNRPLGRVESEGRLSTGLFGGGTDATAENCADEVAAHILANYR
jgi:hypothetical protein